MLVGDADEIPRGCYVRSVGIRAAVVVDIPLWRRGGEMDPTDVTQKMERERDPFDVVTEVIPRTELLEEGIEPSSLDGGNESPKAA
jgi:hypothetical protein